jgi:hypothetical protein
MSIAQKQSKAGHEGRQHRCQEAPSHAVHAEKARDLQENKQNNQNQQQRQPRGNKAARSTRERAAQDAKVQRIPQGVGRLRGEPTGPTRAQNKATGGKAPLHGQSNPTTEHSKGKGEAPDQPGEAQADKGGAGVTPSKNQARRRENLKGANAEPENVHFERLTIKQPPARGSATAQVSVRPTKRDRAAGRSIEGTGGSREAVSSVLFMALRRKAAG